MTTNDWLAEVQARYNLPDPKQDPPNMRSDLARAVKEIETLCEVLEKIEYLQIETYAQKLAQRDKTIERLIALVPHDVERCELNECHWCGCRAVDETSHIDRRCCNNHPMRCTCDHPDRIKRAIEGGE